MTHGRVSIKENTKSKRGSKMEILASWEEYSLIKDNNELKVISLLDSLPKIKVSSDNGEITFRRAVDLVSSKSFREMVADAKLADEAIRMFELYLEDLKEPLATAGEYVNIINDQQLYDYLVRRNHTDEFANYVLSKIDTWNFIEDSFNEFSEELYGEYEASRQLEDPDCDLPSI